MNPIASHAIANVCVVDGCDRKSRSRSLCKRHYARFVRYGDPLGHGSIRRPRGTGTINGGYHTTITAGIKKSSHREIAENALGKPLPNGAIVHHVDGNSLNNKNDNLVICKDQAYHLLIHARARAINSCGNPEYRPCALCKKYDSIESMKSVKRSGRENQSYYYHSKCHAEYERNRKQRSISV